MDLFDSAFLIRSGWTWDQYLETPQEIVSQMVILWNAEDEVARMRIKQAKG